MRRFPRMFHHWERFEYDEQEQERERELDDDDDDDDDDEMQTCGLRHKKVFREEVSFNQSPSFPQSV